MIYPDYQPRCYFYKWAAVVAAEQADTTALGLFCTLWINDKGVPFILGKGDRIHSNLEQVVRYARENFPEPDRRLGEVAIEAYKEETQPHFTINMVNVEAGLEDNACGVSDLASCLISGLHSRCGFNLSGVDPAILDQWLQDWREVIESYISRRMQAGELRHDQFSALLMAKAKEAEFKLKGEIELFKRRRKEGQ